ncbi:SCP [Nesidiocoris tenuis]|uniref:SCP n=1 Tax=Nesidiocoris tenuis TaxID=355587 RepID=A0ABN7B9F1_9HEMI|nr:SCP [Nesidiocoris tenuis]
MIFKPGNTDFCEGISHSIAFLPHSVLALRPALDQQSAAGPLPSRGGSVEPSLAPAASAADADAASDAASRQMEGGSSVGAGDWRRAGSLRSTVGEPPSRRREEAAALLNLQRRVGTEGMTRPNPQAAQQAQAMANYRAKRPQILLKILSNRPEVLPEEEEEVNTDWLDSEFIADCLCWHNVYRQRHAVQVLTLCPQLCEKAQSWANHLAHSNSFFYRSDKEVGQNLFCRLTNTLQTDVTGQEVASYWYGAVRQYNYFKEPDVLHANVNAGHFTQMVWASTSKFGVGKAASRAGKILVVANYWPPGNISGQFQENVLLPIPETETDSMSESETSTSRSTTEFPS